MPSTIHTQDVERQVDLGVHTHPQEPKNIPSLLERAGQGCFLCLESHTQGQYAILVPCLRPIKVRRVIKRKGDDKIMPWDNACESDEDIFCRLLDTCYQHLGRWKRWVPYYGITEVLEVNFRFAGYVDPNRRYSIYMNPIDPKKGLEECEKEIAENQIDPTDPSFDFLDSIDVFGSSEEYQTKMQGLNQRLKRLFFLPHLKEYVRNPARANGLSIFNSSAQESYIYNIKGSKQVKLPLPDESFQETTWIRGMHFILGWQTDRMHIELPFKVSLAWFGIASIWLSLILWRGIGGDWGTAFAFAQVVAASVAIIVTFIQS